MIWWPHVPSVRGICTKSTRCRLSSDGYCHFGFSAPRLRVPRVDVWSIQRDYTSDPREPAGCEASLECATSLSAVALSASPQGRRRSKRNCAYACSRTPKRCAQTLRSFQCITLRVIPRKVHFFSRACPRFPVSFRTPGRVRLCGSCHLRRRRKNPSHPARCSRPSVTCVGSGALSVWVAGH